MKLQDLLVVYISPNHNEKYKLRKNHMDNMLNKIGVKHFEHFQSESGGNYTKHLSEANIAILEKYIDTPVLILEDDVEFTGLDEFDVPEKVDAIYLGISKWGGHPTENTFLRWSTFEEYSTYQVRVMNMLTTHAVLYLTRQYKEAVLRELKMNVGENIDVHYSRLQSRFLVLANKYPSFYQANKWNTFDLEDSTKGYLDNNGSGIRFIAS